MALYKNSFNKSLLICIMSLLSVMLIGVFASRSLDQEAAYFSNLANMSGERRMLTQRIALSALKIQHVNNSTDYEIYKNQLNQAVLRLKYLSSALQTSHQKSQPLQNTIDEFLSETNENGVTNQDLINDFLNTATSLNIAIQSAEEGQDISEDIAPKIALIKKYAQRKILDTYHKWTAIYAEYSAREYSEKRRVKVFLIIFFTLFIFIIVSLSFYPMHQQMRQLLIEADTQKEQFQIERDRLDLAAKGTSTGIWDWDIKTGKILWNSVLKQILGFNDKDEDSFDVDFFQNLLHPSDKNDFNLVIKNHLRKKDIFFFQGRLKHQNGHYLWVELRGEAIRDEDGHAYRMIGSIQDYTVQKEAEIERDLFIQSIETANIAFAIINLNSPARNFSYASPAFCELTGYDFNRITNSNMNMFSGPDTSMNDLDKIDYALINKKELCVKMTNYKSNGDAYFNNVTLKPVFIKGEFSNYFIVTFSDLTETMQNQRQEVERQRNESLGSLAGSVAHEINNLLMPMTMAHDILEDELKDDCDPFAKEQIQTIVDYANQAKAIVQGILTFSRKETEDLQKLDIYEELQEATQFITSLLSSKTTLTLHKTELENAPVMINKIEMKQIITNLCRNAEHAFHGDSGTIDISLSTRKPSKEKKAALDIIANEFAIVSVKDNGSGIEKENLEKIFEPLFTTKDVGEGTGLGLSVVIGIVRSWGGAIDVKSVLGQGTEFEIYIPLYKDSDDFSDLVDLIEDLEKESD